MSKAKKDIINRIEEIFSDIGEGEPPPSTESSGQLVGWTWECDPKGYYTFCSPEVKDYLGVSYRRFIGKSLFTFRVHPRSVTPLKKIIKLDRFPTEIPVLFEAEGNAWVSARMHISRRLDENGGVIGWSGFNLVMIQYAPGELEKETEIEPAPEPQPRAAPVDERKVYAEREKGVEDPDATISAQPQPPDETQPVPEPPPLPAALPGKSRFTRSMIGFENMERLPYPDSQRQPITFTPIDAPGSRRRFPLLEISIILLILILGGLLAAILLGVLQ